MNLSVQEKLEVIIMPSIYLSPSTQEQNRGTGIYGTEETRMNQVADVTQKYLENRGVTVYRNRPDWTLYRVVADSNFKNPDVHLAIHSNADGGRARGCEVYAYAPGGEGEKLARAVYTEFAPLTPTGDRGVKFNVNFYELSRTNAPAALVEIAFHDNPYDAAWIIENILPIGEAIGKGVLEYFGVTGASLAESINVLQEKGVLQSPEYWLANAVKGKTVDGEFAGLLIQRTAALLK